MLLLGIVGFPGSGKSTFAGVLASLGAHVISGDRIGHDVLAHDQRVREGLAVLFGNAIFESGGNVSRRRLGECVVSSEDALHSMNDIVHPSLLKRLAAEIRDVENQGQDTVIAVDAALIPEWGIESYFDLVVYVYCPRTIRLRRLRCQGKDLAVLRQLERFQLAEVKKRRACHIVVDNDGSMDELRHRGSALYRALSAGNRSKGGFEQCQRKLWNG